MSAVAVTGRYVFDQRMDFSRSNFSTFFEAMLLVFQLFTGDSWSSVVYSAMGSMDDRASMLFAGLFIIAWFVFSGLIINNLFVAVIIENFEVTETIDKIAQPGHLAALRTSFAGAWSNLAQSGAAVIRGDVRIDVHGGGHAYDPMRHGFLYSNEASSKLRGLIHPVVEGGSPEKGVTFQNAEVVEEGGGGGGTSLQAPRAKSALANGGTHKRSHIIKVVRWATVKMSTNSTEQTENEYETVLGCIRPESSFRKFFIWLGEQKLFDAAVYSAILASCAFLVMMPPNGVSAADIKRIDPGFPVPVSDQQVKFLNSQRCRQFISYVSSIGS
jgi:hypothetical protein